MHLEEEEEAFNLLKFIMFDLQLRNMFKPDMTGLQVIYFVTSFSNFFIRQLSLICTFKFCFYDLEGCPSVEKLVVLLKLMAPPERRTSTCYLNNPV